MTTDIALLGIGVDTRGVKDGAKALEDLEKKGRAAEGATQRLTKSTDLLARMYRDLAKALAAYKVLDLIRDSALLAARFETMGVVMGVAGNNAGYTRKEMHELEKQMQKTGISMLKSREVLTSLATANIDLSKATGLARAAQDLAVVANINSSEATARMVHGIKSGEKEILKTMGLNVSFENSYKRLASQLSTTTEKLTEHQKVQARTNAVLEESKRYAGIYEESMTTAGKALNSLDRYWENLKVKMGEALLPALADGVFGLTDALKAANAELDKAGNSGQVDRIGTGLSKAFRWAYDAVLTLGAGVTFVMNTTGNLLAAIAATQATIYNGGSWGEVKAIWSGFAEDTTAAKDALVAFENAHRNVPETAAKSAEAIAAEADANEKKRMAAGRASREAEAAEAKRLAAADAAAKAAKKAEADAATRRKHALEYIADLERERLAVGATEQQTKMLAAAKEAAKAPTAALRLAIMQSALALSVETQEHEAAKAAVDALFASRMAVFAAAESAEAAAKESLAQLQFEGELLRMTSADRAIATALRELEKTAIDKSTEAYRKLRVESEKQIRSNEATRAAIDAAKALEDEIKASTKRTGDSLADALMRGGMKARDYLAGLFRNLVLSPIVSPAAASMGSAIGTLPGGDSPGTGILGSIGSSAIGSAVLGGASAFGTGVASGLTAWGAGGSVTGLLGTGSALFSGGIMSGLGTIVGALGPIALGVAAIMSFVKSRGETRVGGQYSGTALIDSPSGGTINGEATTAAIAATMKGIDDALRVLGAGAQVAAFQSGLEQSEKGKGFAYARGTLSTGQAFGDWEREGYMQNRGSMTAEQAAAKFAEELKRATLLAMRAANVGGAVGAELAKIDVGALTGASLEKAFARWAEFLKQREALDEQYLALTSPIAENVARMRQKELDALDPLNRELAAQVRHLTERKPLERQLLELQSTEGENLARARRDELAALDPLNRALAEQIYVLQDAARVAAERQGLERRILELEGNTAAIRQLELDALDPLNRALQERLYALGDEAARTAERQGIARRILELEKNTVEIRRLELAALDPGNRALQERLYALQDEAEALVVARRVADARTGLETRLLQAQNDTLGLRLREFEATDASNRALLLRVWYLEDERAAYAAAKTATDKAVAAVERAVAAEKKLAQAGLEVAKQNVATLRTVFELLQTQARELYAQVTSTADAAAAAGSRFIANALAAARRTGYLPDKDALAEAIRAARGGLTEDRYASQFELDRDRLVLAGRLSELQAISGDQLTEAERQVAALERQVEQLDETLAAAREQVDAIRGVDTSVLSVAAALERLAAALLAEKALTPAKGEQWLDTPAGRVWNSTGGASAVDGPAGVTITGKTGNSFSSVEAQAFVNDRLARGDVAGVYLRAIQEGISANSLDALMEWEPGKSNAEAARLGLPSFATGTDYLPWDGPILAHKGERITPAEYNRSDATNAEILDELRASRRATLEAADATRRLVEKFNNPILVEDANA